MTNPSRDPLAAAGKMELNPALVSPVSERGGGWGWVAREEGGGGGGGGCQIPLLRALSPAF